MKYFKDFTVSINQNAVFKTMDISEQSQNYNMFAEIYDKISNDVLSLCKSECSFVFKQQNIFDTLPCECTHMICAVYTIGSSIPLKITQYFNSGHYFDGMLADHIADWLVLETDNYLQMQILEFLSKSGHGLGIYERLIPGEHIEIGYQNYILDEIKKSGSPINITINDSNMLNPVKSGSFIALLSKDAKLARFPHNCSNCCIVDCKWRNYHITKN